MPLPGRRPILCLVTDRWSLSTRPRDDNTACRDLVTLIGAACQAEIDLVQIRERYLTDRALAELVAQAVGVACGTPTRIIVNDRVDIALAAGAAGVHLKSDGVSAARVRAVVPSEWLIGRSVHGLEDARAAAAQGGADYVALGTIFETASKPDRIPLGIDSLRAVTRAVPLPVLAIGGMTVERAPAVARAGGAGVAAIALFANTPVDAGSVTLSEIVRALRLAFDKGRALV